jgi:hypothetical protein
LLHGLVLGTSRLAPPHSKFYPRCIARYQLAPKHSDPYRVFGGDKPRCLFSSHLVLPSSVAIWIANVPGWFLRIAFRVGVEVYRLRPPPAVLDRARDTSQFLFRRLTVDGQGRRQGRMTRRNRAVLHHTASNEPCALIQDKDAVHVRLIVFAFRRPGLPHASGANANNRKFIQAPRSEVVKALKPPATHCATILRDS